VIPSLFQTTAASEYHRCSSKNNKLPKSRYCGGIVSSPISEKCGLSPDVKCNWWRFVWSSVSLSSCMWQNDRVCEESKYPLNRDADRNTKKSELIHGWHYHPQDWNINGAPGHRYQRFKSGDLSWTFCRYDCPPFFLYCPCVIYSWAIWCWGSSTPDSFGDISQLIGYLDLKVHPLNSTRL
jgi:hypothetical protein